MNNRIFQIMLFSWLFLFSIYLPAQSVADPNFQYLIEQPRYDIGKGPVVLYDEGHNNPFTLKGQYAAFAHVLEADGYQLETLRQKIDAKVLLDARVFVTVNALYNLENWGAQKNNVYTEEEVDILYNWVYKDGGSLFLVTDQMPAAGSVSNLAARFGFNLINGFAQRKDGRPEIFSRVKGNLTANPITDVKDFAIDSIRNWVGTGFIPAPDAIVVSWLDKDYDVFLPFDGVDKSHPTTASAAKIDGIGLANSAILECGKGKVFIIADASPFYALLRGIKSDKRGMNHPDATQNAQFLLNVINWLTTP